MNPGLFVLGVAFVLAGVFEAFDAFCDYREKTLTRFDFVCRIAICLALWSLAYFYFTELSNGNA